MKVSKKEIYLFTFSIVLGLLLGTTIINAIGVDTTPLPGASLQWDITDTQIIDGVDYYLNETITIETGGELRILNSNFYINADSLRIDVRQGGVLYVENSNLMVTNPSYIYTISSLANVDYPLVGSNYSFIDSNVYNAEISITQYLEKFCEFIALNTTFEMFEEVTLNNFNIIDIDQSTFYNSTEGLVIDSAQDINIQDTTFQLLAYGINIDDSRYGTLGYNQFLDITETGLIVDDFSQTNLQGQRVVIEWNTFDNTVIGAILEDSRMHFINNDLRNLDVGVSLDNSDFGIYEYNNFTSISDICMDVVDTAATYVQHNYFEDSETGIDLLVSPIRVTQNQFENLTTGIDVYDSDALKVYNNDFNNISYYSMYLDESREVEIYQNTMTNSLGGILLTHARLGLIQENLMDNVEDGVAITYSRDVSVLGNTVNNTISGFYIETTSEIILTANGAINAQYGMSLWSVSDVVLASNGVFDSVYGISIWFSELIELSGNDVSTSDIGIVGRNTVDLHITDGSYTELTKGVQLLGCNKAIVSGNTFDDIVEEAITLSDSSDFIVYNNNFLTVGAYGSISNSFGTFYRQLDNVTFVGNYYEGEPAGVPVLIDEFTIDLVTYNITDYYPLDSAYTVRPTVEYLSRNILQPTDIDPVVITTQVFIPEGTQNTEVYLQYNLINETVWRVIDITSTEEPIGSIGAISQFQATIVPLPYSFQVTYRIMVNFTISLVEYSVFSDNGTYEVGESEFTPIVIGVPEVRVVTYSEESEQDVTVVTNTFYQDTEYLIFVSVKNKTDLQLIGGKRHVNLSWYEIDPTTNETQYFSGIMDYNSSLAPMSYYAAFGKGYAVGMILKFFISVVDANGTFYRTILNYTMYIEPPVEETGFDTITLLSIGGTLLIAQIIVVYRRRRKVQEE